MRQRHRILVIEDHPPNAETLCDMVRSMDMEPRLVGTLAEVHACFEEGYEPCGVLQDMQIPHSGTARPHEKSGESSIALIQARWRGEGRVAIVVVTGFRMDPDYVWEMAELGVDGFVSKKNIEGLPGKLLRALKKNGREDHARCAECSRQSRVVDVVVPDENERAAEPVARKVTLEIDGEPVKGRTSLRICGERRLMPDAKLIVLLRAVLADESERGSWTDRYELGIGDDRGMTTRVREPFDDFVPDGFAVLEGDGRKQFRLNQEIVVLATNWDALAKHPHPAVRNVAALALKKKTRAKDRNSSRDDR